jgi:hypothetical protein
MKIFGFKTLGGIVMTTRKALFAISLVLLLILLCVIFAQFFAHKEIVNDTSPDLGTKTNNIAELVKEDSNEIYRSSAIRSDSQLTVSPTLELDDLITRFEKEIFEESEEQSNLATAIIKMKDYKKSGGTLWGSEKWMKDLDYYKSLKTTALAEECFSRPIYSFEVNIFDDPRIGLERLRIFHNGFQVLFQRDDMWEGILRAYEYLSSKLNLESDLKTIVIASGTLDALRVLYGFPEFKEQAKGREEMFLSANVRVLKKFAWYLENYDPKKLGTGGSPGFFREPCSVAQVALMLTKQVDPQRYNSIESEIKSVRWPEEQNVQDLKEFIKLVLNRLEGVVPAENSETRDNVADRTSVTQ